MIRQFLKNVEKYVTSVSLPNVSRLAQLEAIQEDGESDRAGSVMEF